MDGTRRTSARVVAAGAALMVLGALWFTIGAVLLAVSLLFGRGVGAIPPSVDADPGLVLAAPRAGVTGLVAIVAGVGQLAAGYAATRQPGPWMARLGAGLALVGLGVVGSWLVNGLSASRPVLVLLPVALVYAYVAAALLVEAAADPRAPRSVTD